MSQQLKVCIHANGGYDVVAIDETGVEGEIREYVGFAMNPVELDEVAKRFTGLGAIVADFRSPAKQALADAAKAAVTAMRELIILSWSTPGVEPEAIEKAKLYAARCVRLATEVSC